MSTPRHTAADHAAMIRKYFAACNAGSYEQLIDCFTPDAVHYFPAGLPEVPWRSADMIARKWVWCVEHLGSRWTIEKILVSHDSPEAVIEWTHWKTAIGKTLRGDEWYRFCPETGKISEIRAYYASPADQEADINQLVDFDYAGRGYALKPPGAES